MTATPTEDSRETAGARTWTVTCNVCERSWTLSGEAMPSAGAAPTHLARRGGEDLEDRCPGSGRTRAIRLEAPHELHGGDVVQPGWTGITPVGDDPPREPPAPGDLAP